jgi:hypothetical protein
MSSLFPKRLGIYFSSHFHHLAIFSCQQLFSIPAQLFFCTQSHQKCQIDTHLHSQWKCYTKFGLPLVIKLSFHRRRNDLKVPSVAYGVVKSGLVALLDLGDGPNHPDATQSKNNNTNAIPINLSLLLDLG